MIGAFRKRLSPRLPDAFQLPILRRLQDFLMLKDCGGLVDPVPVNAHLVDAPHHGGLFVNDPVFGVVGAFHIAVGRQRKRDTGITAQTLGASDFTGNIPGVPLVHNVAEGRKLITGDAVYPVLNFRFEMEAQSYTAPSYSSETLAPAAMPMPAESAAGVKTASINGAGDVHFGGFSFSKPGVYVYTVKEIAGTDPFTTYDSKVYTFTYTVTDTAGTLGSALVISEPSTSPDPAAATFTNTYVRPLGNLIIRKRVDGAGGGAVPFNFLLSFSESGAYSYSGDYSGTVSSGGSVNLMHGETITILVPYGVTYTVVEVPTTGFTTSPASRTFTGTIGATDSLADYVNYVIAEDTGSPAPSDPSVPPRPAEPGTPVGSLIIKNTITGDNADNNQSFTFTVSFSDGGTYLYTGSKGGAIESGGKVYLKHGEFIHIVGIPAGVHYTVIVSGNDGYRTYYSGTAGVIEDEGSQIASFVSSKSSVPATGDDRSILARLTMMLAAALGIAFIKKKDSDRRRRWNREHM